MTRTVKNHVSSILFKLGVRDRVQAVLKGLDIGVLWVVARSISFCAVRRMGGICLGFAPSLLMSAPADWDCQRKSDSGEWLCGAKTSVRKGIGMADELGKRIVKLASDSKTAAGVSETPAILHR